jgi:hypothetical protein
VTSWYLSFMVKYHYGRSTMEMMNFSTLEIFISNQKQKVSISHDYKKQIHRYYLRVRMILTRSRFIRLLLGWCLSNTKNMHQCIHLKKKPHTYISEDKPGQQEFSRELHILWTCTLMNIYIMDDV